MKIDLPNMDFDIPSIPDPHFEPKINYKALEEMAKSRDEYLTTLRNAIPRCHALQMRPLPCTFPSRSSVNRCTLLSTFVNSVHEMEK
jgi:hypothetical protein